MSLFPNYTQVYDKGNFFPERNDWSIEHRDVRRPTGGGSLDLCVPWAGAVVDEQDYTSNPNANPDYKFRMNFGTVSGVGNSNWADAVPYAGAKDQLYYVIVEVTLSQAIVTNVSYRIDATVPTGDKINPIARDSVPNSIDIVMGSIINQDVCMIYHDNIRLQPVELYREPNPNAGEKEMPFIMWYTLKVEPTGDLANSISLINHTH